MSVLYEPIKIKGMEIPNRIMRSATFENMCEGNGFFTDKLTRVYEELAKGEIGLIVTGAAHVQPRGFIAPTQIGIYSDEHVPGLKRMVDVVHRYPGMIATQLHHVGRRGIPAMLGETPIAPSAVGDSQTGVVPREMTDDEIITMIEDFAKGARRAREAGFDAVQLHGAHGYLISEFLSSHVNQRTDAWGGSLENRMRFLTKIYRRCRETVGDDYPIGVKLGVIDYVEGGLTLEESCTVVKTLCDMGMDFVEISAGVSEGKISKSALKGINSTEKEAYFLKMADVLKGHMSVPLALVGGLRTPSLMEKVLEEKRADIVSLCRPFIREPHLVRRWKEGDTAKSACISCNKCMEGIFDGDLRCYQV